MPTGRTLLVDERDDAALARAAADGDRSAFAAIYDRYADRLHDFCVGMLRDRDTAADCVQDVFVTAATRLPQLREPDRLRSWLYAIARNEALARIRSRRRELPSDELPDVASGEPDLETLAARSELADLISEACGGLSDRDHVVLELAYRQGLDGPELAEALGVTNKNANTLVERVRATIERSLGALLVCRGVRAAPSRCPELAALIEHWDGQFTVLMRKRAARHIESCAVCDEERARLVSPAALLGSVPVFLPAPVWLREHTLNDAANLLPSATSAPAASASPGSDLDESCWPPDDLDISDLGDPIPEQHPGTEPSGREPSTAGERSGYLGRHTRVTAGAALLLLAIGGGLVLTHPVSYEVEPVSVPAGIPTTATTTPPTPATPSDTSRAIVPPTPQDSGRSAVLVPSTTQPTPAKPASHASPPKEAEDPITAPPVTVLTTEAVRPKPKQQPEPEQEPQEEADPPPPITPDTPKSTPEQVTTKPKIHQPAHIPDRVDKVGDEPCSPQVCPDGPLS